jgi:hypothetical protein
LEDPLHLPLSRGQVWNHDPDCAWLPRFNQPPGPSGRGFDFLPDVRERDSHLAIGLVRHGGSQFLYRDSGRSQARDHFTLLGRVFVKPDQQNALRKVKPLQMFP